MFFSDLDSERPFNPRAAIQVGLFLICGLISVFLLFHSPILALAGLLLTFALIWFVSTFWKVKPASENPWEQNAIASVRAYIDRNPGWNARVYRTPAGLRVMVTHRPFLPNEPEVKQFFEELKVDPVYQLMCFRQNCFRARVSPKPWRIGIKHHIRPRPGVWPITPEQQPQRNIWVQNYESASVGFAACQFIESIGNGFVAQEILPVVSWHDELCKAESGLPLA